MLMLVKHKLIVLHLGVLCALRGECSVHMLRGDLKRMTLLIVALLGALWPARAFAQEADRCRVLCAPQLNFEPTLSVENLLAAPKVATLTAGVPSDTVQLTRGLEAEWILAVDVPTALSRVGLTLEAIFPMFADDNEPELEAELNLELLTGAETGGWVSSHFDIVDQFSPAERPGAARPYSHKLDLELDVAFAVLQWLPERHWLRAVELEGSLDYLATGLPRRGDRIGDLAYLDDASPWSLSLLLVVPLAP